MVKERKRRGGSKARKAIRKQSPKKEVVTQGLEGGKYLPLSNSEIEQIHQTALDVLEKIGIGDAIPGNRFPVSDKISEYEEAGIITSGLG